MNAFMNVADLKCPDDPQGRTYRQINAEKKHSIQLGTLVELKSGVRLFVALHGRDCDQTPLYWLSHKYADKNKMSGGHIEENLKVIKEPPRLVRTLIKVNEVDRVANTIKVFVAGRPASEQVTLRIFNLPAEVRQVLRINGYLHAKVNTGADIPENLIFQDWEIN